MGYQCHSCKKKFQKLYDLNQHIHSKHFNYPLMVDEMLSGKEPECRQLKKDGRHVIGFPVHLKGQSDHVILDYVKQMKFGLITRDKQFARKAKSILAKVILL